MIATHQQVKTKAPAPRPASGFIPAHITALVDRIEAQTFAPWANKPGPSDAEILQMVGWYEERQFGAFAIESDAFDKEIYHA